jgi:hypothetical protein
MRCLPRHHSGDNRLDRSHCERCDYHARSRWSDDRATPGRSVDADEVDIADDVDGVMTTDPRLVKHAKVLITSHMPK